MTRTATVALLLTLVAMSGGAARGQAIAARKTTPNLESSMDTPLRYRPEGGDFVIENGAEFFNRPLYGGNTAFRVDAGDKPEFSLYGLPGRGGVLRLGVRNANGAKWLNNAASVVARYRPGGMIYDIRDPMLGAGTLHIEAYALAATEGLIVRVEGRGVAEGVEWLWAYGGANGARGARDGDIGTEKVPISEYFQLAPENCRTNVFTPAAGAFMMKFPIGNNPVTIFGRVPGEAGAGGGPEIADAQQWGDPGKLFGSVKAGVGGAVATPVIVGYAALGAEARYLSLQHLGTAAVPADLQVVTGDAAEAAPSTALLAAFSEADLPKVFANAEAHFKSLRERMMIDTPDPYLNAAAGALNVAADAVWDDGQHAIMHGAVAWRQKLLGWRGPYCLDDLGWHDRAEQNFATWAPKQNVKPIPAQIPPADEGSNLSRNEAGLHSNGDMSNSHYDMNMVHMDAAFRHILWTGDVEFAKREWPIIERDLAWEQRLFRRPFGPEKLPLYEAYAAIWASDDLEYDGGGTAHASAYNYYHNKMAARVAKMLGKDPAPYEKEAGLIARAMREYLWLPEKGWFAEYRDYLGMQLAHESAGLWSIYHTIDSEVPTPMEAWQMTRYLDTQMPHIPVHGPGVPEDEAYAMLPETTWMPYLWSINNVCMNEDNATALAYYQAGRGDAGTRLLKSGVLASMYMGISPGNVGTMDYLDVYRRESQRDFGDASGTLSRTIVEGLFGIRPDGISGEFTLAPGFPDSWDHAAIKHPDVSYSFKRAGSADAFVIEPHFSKPLAIKLELPARSDRVASLTINGQPAKWTQRDDAVGVPRIVISGPAAAKWEIVITWAGSPIAAAPAPMHLAGGEQVRLNLDPHIKPLAPLGPHIVDPQQILRTMANTEWTNFEVRENAAGAHTFFVSVSQGDMNWKMPVDVEISSPKNEVAYDWSKPQAGGNFETVDLAKLFNDRVTQIFKNQYRTPRSPFVSLAIPKQGIGAWAGESTATAAIDDTGLRAASTKGGGKIVMPNGVPFATPGTGPGGGASNIVFTSQFDNYPKQVEVPLAGKARRVLLLMAGSTNPMQSRFDNGEVVVTYADGTTARLALTNPDNWWPIEQDYFIDDYQFRRPGPIPPRVNLRTGEVRLLNLENFKGKGGTVAGGAATALELALDSGKELKSLTVHTLANEVVVGLMAVTVER